MRTLSEKLTPLQDALLSEYKRHNGNKPLSLGQLASLLNTSKSAVQRARDSLLERKLIAVGKYTNRKAGKPPRAAKVRVIQP